MRQREGWKKREGKKRDQERTKDKADRLQSIQNSSEKRRETRETSERQRGNALRNRGAAALVTQDVFSPNVVSRCQTVRDTSRLNEFRTRSLNLLLTAETFTGDG